MNKPTLREGHVWTDRRVEQFQQLQELLNECRSIDSANHIIDRLKRISEMGKALSDWSVGEPGFIDFLREQVAKDRFQEE